MFRKLCEWKLIRRYNILWKKYSNYITKERDKKERLIFLNLKFIFDVPVYREKVIEQKTYSILFFEGVFFT